MWRSASRSSSAVETPGLQGLLDQREDLGDDAAGGSHLGDVGLGVALDHVCPPTGATPASVEDAVDRRGDRRDGLLAVDGVEHAGWA